MSFSSHSGSNINLLVTKGYCFKKLFATGQVPTTITKVKINSARTSSNVQTRRTPGLTTCSQHHIFNRWKGTTDNYGSNEVKEFNSVAEILPSIPYMFFCWKSGFQNGAGHA